MMSWLAVQRLARRKRSWLLPTGTQQLVLRGSGTGDQEPRAYRDVYCQSQSAQGRSQQHTARGDQTEEQKGVKKNECTTNTQETTTEQGNTHFAPVSPEKWFGALCSALPLVLVPHTKHNCLILSISVVCGFSSFSSSLLPCFKANLCPADAVSSWIRHRVGHSLTTTDTLRAGTTWPSGQCAQQHNSTITVGSLSEPSPAQLPPAD